MSDTPGSEVTLSAVGLSRSYGGKLAVDDISLELRRGQIIGLLGPNGAGKTTTMKMITGTLAPTRGSVSICGIDLIDRPIAAKAKLGYLPEVSPLYRELRVDEYLRFAGWWTGDCICRTNGLTRRIRLAGTSAASRRKSPSRQSPPTRRVCAGPMSSCRC